MKKILIAGKNSYIGMSFENALSKYIDRYSIDTIDMRSEAWKNKDFSLYDVVVYVAAIVHVKESNIDKYYKINRDLALEVAKKAKISGVSQFIFFSTMGVYGMKTGHITDQTIPNPKTHYAKSKLEAEKLLEKFEDDKFKVAIIRPPIVYGYKCKGNYNKISKFVLKIPVFPKINNQRSMIYIENLVEFMRIVIDECLGGLYFPQNKEYVNTAELAKAIADIHGKKIILFSMFNYLILILVKISDIFGKVFGSYTYDMNMLGGNEYLIKNMKDIKYDMVNFEESVKKTELGDNQ